MTAYWKQTRVGGPVPTDFLAVGGLTAWTCRPGRNGSPSNRWRVLIIGAGRPDLRPMRMIPVRLVP